MILDMVAPRVVYLLVLMVALLLVQKLAKMVVPISLAGDILRGVFSTDQGIDETSKTVGWVSAALPIADC